MVRVWICCQMLVSMRKTVLYIAPSGIRRARSVEPHGFSLLRRSSFGYEGRAAVAPPLDFGVTRRSVPSFAKATEGYPPRIHRPTP